MKMFTKSPTKSPVGQKQLQESFEEKHERRLEFHEVLRSRYNITTCRQDSLNWSREQERQAQSPRQLEFFKRRHLWADNDGDKQVKSPPRSQRYARHSPGKEILNIKIQSKDLMSSPQNEKNSLLHVRSWSDLLDCKKISPNPVDNNHNWESLYNRINKNDISRCEIGVQTVQELSKICIKRDSSQQTDCSTAVLNGELLQLSEYLMEALQRERKLKKKLCVLQELVNALMQTSEKSWKAYVAEDKLKCKVANLENQLFIYSQNYPKSSVKKILLEMEEQKYRYEIKAKKSLQKLSEDKLVSEGHLHEAQRSLVMSTDECELWKEEYERLKLDWKEMTNKNYELKNELHVLQSKLQWVETKDNQLQQLQNHLWNLEREKIELQAQNDLLQEDNNQKEEKLHSMEVRLKNTEMQKLEVQMKLGDLQNDILVLKQRSSSPPPQDAEILPLGHLQDGKLQLDRLQLVMEKLIAKEKEVKKLLNCADLQTEMESLTEEYRSCQRKLQLCREQLKGTQGHKSKRHCSFWAPLFVMMVAVIIMVLFSTNIEYFIH